MARFPRVPNPGTPVPDMSSYLRARNPSMFPKMRGTEVPDMASYLHARGQMPGVNPGVPRNERVARSPGAPDVAGAVQNPGKDNWMVAAAQRDPMWRGGASGWSGGSGSSGYTGNYSSAGGVPRMRAYRNGGVVKGEKDAVGDYRKALSKMKDYRNK